MQTSLGPITKILWQYLVDDTTPTATLSRRTGIPRCTIDRFREGRGGIAGTTVDKLADYYGLRLVPKAAGSKTRRAKARKGG